MMKVQCCGANISINTNWVFHQPFISLGENFALLNVGANRHLTYPINN